jgi:hypothetical protein
MFEKLPFSLFLIGMIISPAFAQEDIAPSDGSVHAPRIVCAEPTYDFGERDSTETVEHTFTIKNEGDLTLVLSRVRPSCGCTVANLSRDEVPPGEEAQLSTRLSLKGRSGRQRKNIRVESNDPETPNLMLYLEGSAVNNIEIKPRHIYFGQLSQDAVATSVVEVTSLKPLEIKAASSTVDYFEVILDPLQDGGGYRVSVVTKPPLAQGSSQGEIRLERGQGEALTIPASVMVVGPLAVAPSELVVKEGDDRSVTRYIIIRAGEVKEFAVTGVEVPDERISVTTTALGANGYRIQLDQIPPDPALNGKPVVIRTDTEKLPEIEIPFKIIPGN